MKCVNRDSTARRKYSNDPLSQQTNRCFNNGEDHDLLGDLSPLIA